MKNRLALRHCLGRDLEQGSAWTSPAHFPPQYSLCRQCEWRTFRLRGFWGCKAMECLLLSCPLRHAWTAQAVAPEIRTMVYAVLDTGRLCMCFGGNLCLHAAIPVEETLKDLHRMQKT